jgi:hypothetical protein
MMGVVWIAEIGAVNGRVKGEERDGKGIGEDGRADALNNARSIIFSLTLLSWPLEKTQEENSGILYQFSRIIL